MPYMETRDNADPAVAISKAIGRRVRRRRIDRGWTLDELASRSGVSRRMLVNVEQGGANPSIATLLRLADALGIGLPALVEPAEDERTDVAIHRAGEVVPLWTTEAGGAAVLVAGGGAPHIHELWDWRLGPGDVYSSEAHPTGTRELLHVLSGTVALVVDGSEHRLATGDSAAFDASAAHSYGNASGAQTARFSLAVFQPAAPTETR